MSITYDGNKLADLLARVPFTQAEVARRIGCDESRISRWKRQGIRGMRRGSVEALAAALKMSTGELEAEIGITPTRLTREPLTPAEQEVLSLFRGLSAMEQAQALLDFAKMVSQLQPSPGE